jgi:hypothetical protein
VKVPRQAEHKAHAEGDEERIFNEALARVFPIKLSEQSAHCPSMAAQLQHFVVLLVSKRSPVRLWSTWNRPPRSLRSGSARVVYETRLPRLNDAPESQLVRFKLASRRGLKLRTVECLIALPADDPRFLSPGSVPRIPVVELGARKSAVLIADGHRFTARAQAVSARPRHLAVDLLSPSGKRPALHGQTLAQILHLGAERQLAGVQTVKALSLLVHPIRDDAQDVLDRKVALRLIFQVFQQRSLCGKPERQPAIAAHCRGGRGRKRSTLGSPADKRQYRPDAHVTARRESPVSL